MLASRLSCDSSGEAEDLQPSVATAWILTDANHDVRHQMHSAGMEQDFVLTFPRHTHVALDR